MRNLTGLVSVVALAALLACRCGKEESAPSSDKRTPEKIAEDERKAAQAQAEQQEPAAKPAEPKWYSGGTLHSSTAAEWRTATRANKLATAADFISKLHESGKLKNKISAQIKEVDDLRAPADELVIALDKALGDGTPSTTKVTDAALLAMGLMAWI